MRQRSIRFWLTCLVLGCVLPATLGSAFLFVISYQQQRAILERNTVATARALMQAIDAELFGVQSALQVLATSQRLASGDLASFYRQAIEALPSIGGNYVIVTDRAGQQRLNTSKPFGDLLPQATPSDNVRRVFETGTPAISDFFVTPVSGLPVIALEVPVFDAGVVIHTLATVSLPIGLPKSCSDRLCRPTGWWRSSTVPTPSRRGPMPLTAMSGARHRPAFCAVPAIFPKGASRPIRSKECRC